MHQPMQTIHRALAAAALAAALSLSAGGVGYRAQAQPIDGRGRAVELALQPDEPTAGQNDMCMAADRAGGSPPGGGSISIPIRKIGDIERLRKTFRTLNTQGYNYRDVDVRDPVPGAAESSAPR
jgi:hypothetical protein